MCVWIMFSGIYEMSKSQITTISMSKASDLCKSNMKLNQNQNHHNISGRNRLFLPALRHHMEALACPANLNTTYSVDIELGYFKTEEQMI